MNAEDVQETLDMTIAETGTDQVIVKHRPRLLSDTGPCYISGELKKYLKNQKMDHTRRAPYHPQTQGKIERYHRSMKNGVKLDNYYLPGDLELEIGKRVDHYNNERIHESLDNVTPADMYFGQKEKILTQRQIIKQKTLLGRKRINLKLQHTEVLV